jgi:hypothetical protein
MTNFKCKPTHRNFSQKVESILQDSFDFTHTEVHFTTPSVL